MKMERVREHEIEDVIEDVLEQFFEVNAEQSDDSEDSEVTSVSDAGSQSNTDMTLDIATESQPEYDDEQDSEECKLNDSDNLSLQDIDDDNYDAIYDFVANFGYEAEQAAKKNNQEPETLKTKMSTHSFIAQEIRKINETYPLWAPPEFVPPIDFRDKTWAYEPPERVHNEQQFDAHKIEEANRRVGAQFIKEVNRGIYGININDSINNSTEYHNAAQNYALSGLCMERQITNEYQSSFTSYTATTSNNETCISQSISMTQTSTTYSDDSMQRSMKNVKLNVTALNRCSQNAQPAHSSDVVSTARSQILMIEQLRVLNTTYIQQQQQQQAAAMPVNIMLGPNIKHVPTVYANPMQMLPMLTLGELFPTTLVAQRAITGGTLNANTVHNPILPALPAFNPPARITTAATALNPNSAPFYMHNATYTSLQAMCYSYAP